MENQKPFNDLENPEFTLEEAEQWLLKVENDAWCAESRAGSLEFLVLNLFMVLAEKGVLDGEQLIQRLERQLPVLNKPHQIGAEVLIAHLRALLSGEDPGGFALH